MGTFMAMSACPVRMSLVVLVVVYCSGGLWWSAVLVVVELRGVSGGAQWW